MLETVLSRRRIFFNEVTEHNFSLFAWVTQQGYLWMSLQLGWAVATAWQ